MSKRLDYEVGDCTGRLGGDGDARLSRRPIVGISVISRIGSVMIAAPKTGPVQVAVIEVLLRVERAAATIETGDPALWL